MRSSRRTAAASSASLTLLVVLASLEKLATWMLERELRELQQRAQGQAGTGGGGLPVSDCFNGGVKRERRWAFNPV